MKLGFGRKTLVIPVLVAYAGDKKLSLIIPCHAVFYLFVTKIFVKCIVCVILAGETTCIKLDTPDVTILPLTT